jgi:hypothetical protein
VEVGNLMNYKLRKESKSSIEKERERERERESYEGKETH